MATRIQNIYDIKTILEGSGITDESRLDEDYVGYKLDQKRAKEIRDTYMRNRVIEPIWIQDMGICKTTNVNKAQDQSVSICKCSFSKVILPPVVSLHDEISGRSDLGYYRMASSCGSFEFHQSTMAKLALLNSDSMYSLFKYFLRVGNGIYLTPIVQNIRPFLILENPLDGYVFDNTDKLSGDLVSGESYTIHSGSIIYNSVRYQEGQSFTANSTSTFTGLGKVYLTTQKRRMTNDDEYPMSSTMAEIVIKKICTEDYAIEAQHITDLKNDSQDANRALRENR